MNHIVPKVGFNRNRIDSIRFSGTRTATAILWRPGTGFGQINSDSILFCGQHVTNSFSLHHSQICSYRICGAEHLKSDIEINQPFWPRWTDAKLVQWIYGCRQDLVINHPGSDGDGGHGDDVVRPGHHHHPLISGRWRSYLGPPSQPIVIASA